jgi:molecular chaperone GrpE
MDTTYPDENGAAETTPGDLSEQLAAAREEAARNLEGWQRTQAEFANARKRLEKQRADAYVDANIDLVRKLLPVVDDMDRALQSAPADVQGDGWFSGLTMVGRKFGTVLESLQVEPIDAVGQPFDPNLHEAIGQEPTDEYESGIVSREMQKGYRLGDRVIRPSLVYVAA